MKLLADTSALLALALRNDAHHPAAAGFVRQNPAARFVLTELILAEATTGLHARAGADQAVVIGRNLLESRRYEVLFVGADVVRAALRFGHRGQLDRSCVWISGRAAGGCRTPADGGSW
jgi:predicted nucleic acid-binding protein